MSIFKNLMQFDYFNFPIKLRLGGYDSHKTLLGLSFTIINLVVLVFISIYFGKEMIE
jgi:hypothetical protein